MRSSFAVGVIALLLVCSCATPYQEHGLRGGYRDRQIDGNTWAVSCEGNAYTLPEQLEDYVIHRCAELTVEQEADYFVIVRSRTERGYASATVKIFKGEPAPGDRAAMEARQVLEFVGPRVR
jgi:hypothetical protein